MPKTSRLDKYGSDIDASLAAGATRAAVARSLGVHVNTLKSWLDNRGAEREAPVAPVIGEPEESPSREELLAAELAELKASGRKSRKTQVAEERIIAAIEVALGEYEPIPTLDTAQCYVGEQWAPMTSEAHHRQVVLLSDFHGGEMVDRDAVNGRNSYDWEIMEQRVKQVIASLLSHKSVSPALTGLDVLFLGDMCSGSNHLELAETNEYNAAEQGIKMGHLLGQLVEQLLPYYGDVKVSGVVGNHPRTSVKPAAKNVWSNFDWVAYKYCELYLARHSVPCDFPKAGALFYEIAGQTFYVFHGDGIRSSMPGVPWGGVMRRTNEIRRQHADRKIDGFMLGHFHQANAILDLGIFMNGALKGTDEWVMKQFGGGSQPRQLLLTFDEKNERLTDVRTLDPTAGL